MGIPDPVYRDSRYISNAGRRSQLHVEVRDPRFYVGFGFTIYLTIPADSFSVTPLDPACT